MNYLDYNSPIVDGGNFKWAEYALLHDWNCLAIASDAEIQNAKVLFSHLQTIREQLRDSLIIKSGARTKEYSDYLRSKGIPAALASAHNEWAAVDIYCPFLPVKDLWTFCDKRWLGRMELVQYTPTWVHLDTRQWGQKVRFKP